MNKVLIIIKRWMPEYFNDEELEVNRGYGYYPYTDQSKLLEDDVLQSVDGDEFIYKSGKLEKIKKYY